MLSPKHEVSNMILSKKEIKPNPCTACIYSHGIIGLILGLRPANERRRYFVPTSLIGWAQAWNQPWVYIRQHLYEAVKTTLKFKASVSLLLSPTLFSCAAMPQIPHHIIIENMTLVLETRRFNYRFDIIKHLVKNGSDIGANRMS